MIWSPFTERKDKWERLSFSGGIILPTGESADQPLVGETAPDVFQLGTGAFQLMLGSSYVWSANDWDYRLDLNAVLPLNESSDGFTPASSFSGTMSAGKYINDDVGFSMGLNLTYSGPDEFREEDLITDYTSLTFKTGVFWQLKDRLLLTSSVSLPLYQKVNQTQLAAGPEFQIGLNRSF